MANSIDVTHCDHIGYDNEDCYYRQLQRRSQDCERLTKALAEIKSLCKAEIHALEDGSKFRYTMCYKILKIIEEVEE